MKRHKRMEVGDGLALHNAVRLSNKTAEEIYAEMGVSNGTFYNFYKMEVLDDEVKKRAAKALGTTVDNIFGEISKVTGADGEAIKKRVRILGEALAGTEETMEYSDLEAVYADQSIDVGDLLRDSESAFVVYGNSMTPAYPSGCVLGIRRNLDGFIQPGETYLIVTKSNMIFKRLYYNDERTAFEAYSDNTMVYETGPKKGKYAYPPFPVKFDDVLYIYDVIGMIKRNRNTGIIQRQK